MTSTLPRRTAAVTALALTALSGAGIIGATAASASPKAHTSLSIRAFKAQINPGGSDQITGELRSGRGGVQGHKIELLSRATGATTWTDAATHFAGRHGDVGFEVTPATTTFYKLKFAGNKFEQGSRSGVVRVRVNQAATSLTIAEATKSVAPGGSDQITGVLSAAGTPLAGQTVALLGARVKHNLKQIGTATSAADGSVSFTVTPGATSHYALVFRKTATEGAARSAAVTVRVLEPSSLSIRARANTKAGKEIIGGDLRGGGNGLRHRKVVLQDRPAGTTTWTTVASKLTGKGGGVSFSEPAPTVSEDYQLVFAGGSIFDGCQSGVVTATVTTVTP
jgi:hypothetical protein